jgi:hypothetical protein
VKIITFGKITREKPLKKLTIPKYRKENLMKTLMFKQHWSFGGERKVSKKKNSQHFLE